MNLITPGHRFPFSSLWFLCPTQLLEFLTGESTPVSSHRHPVPPPTSRRRRRRLRRAMKPFPSSLIFGLSAAQLAVGVAKIDAPFLWTTRFDYGICILIVAVLLEVALCASVNVLSVLNATSTPGPSLEWKLLAAAAVGVVLMLFLEFVAVLIFVISATEQKEKPSKFCSLVASSAILALLAPLAFQFFRTVDRSALLFTSTAEKAATIAAIALPLLPMLPLGLFFLHGYCPPGCGFFFYVIFLVVFGAQLPVIAGLAAWGAVDRDKAVLLTTLLVTAPPTASLSFAAVKVSCLKRSVTPRIQHQRAHPPN